MIEVKNHFVKHLWFYPMALLMLILLGPLIFNETSHKVSGSEREYFESIGVNVQLAESRAQSTFQDVFVGTGIKANFDKLLKPQKSTGKDYSDNSSVNSGTQAFSKMRDFSAGYAERVWATVFKGITRLHMLWPIMLSVLICMGIPCLIDGIVTRAKKTYNFEYHNPVYFWTSGHAFSSVLGLSLLLPFLPISIALLAVSAFITVMCVSIWMLASNFQTGV